MMFLAEHQPPPRYNTDLEADARDTLVRKSFEPSAWQIGVTRYLSTIPTEYKDAFKAPAHPEECLRLLQQAQSRNHKFDRLVTILQPLVEPLKRFEASVDVLVQTYSTVASPIWGPIRILITIASTRLSTLENVVILLERLVEPLKRFHNYETLFKYNSILRNAIGSLYCDLIEFCARIISHQTKNPLKKTFASFDKDVTQISDKIRHHWAEVDIAANAANLMEAKEARAREEDQRVHDFRRDVNRWLSPAASEDDLNRLNSICAAGSCQWILETEATRTFLSEASSTLRMSAYPGGGKSVAAASIIQHLQQQGRIVLYSFCKCTDAEKSFTTSIVRTLVWQLLQSDHVLYETLSPIYNRSGRQIADSEVLAFEMFELVFKATRHEEIILVLDALDECYDAGSLMRLLNDTQKATKAKMKVLVTSRDDPELAEILSCCTAEVLLQSNTRPLAKYIEEEVENLPLPILPDERCQIRVAVQEASNGLWLFASLMMEELKKTSSVSEIHEQLRTVPEGLAQLYNSIMKSKEKSFTKIQMRMAQQLYLWLRMKDYIPQSSWRAKGTKGLDDELVHTIFQYAMKRPDGEVFHPMEMILRLCSPLVTTRLLHADHIVTYIEGKPHHCSSFVAEVFHQTAEQYLQWCQESTTSSDMPMCMQPRRLADLHRAACAVWYFSESEHFRRSLSHLRERPRSEVEDCSLEMACGFWGAMKIDKLRRDLTDQEVDDAEELCENLIAFLDSESCLAFVEASIILYYSGESTLVADNVQDGDSEAFSCLSPVSTSSSRQKKYDFLNKFIEVRDLFKADVAFAIRRFPAARSTTDLNEPDRTLVKPDMFEKRPRARKIFALARKYRWVALAPRAVSINGFLMSGKT